MRIYLDHNATTPLRDEVVEAISRTLADCYGNPSSTHAEGAEARRRVEDAREQVAACLGAAPRTVIFTAGATEANNTVLRGLWRGADSRGSVVTSQIEHPSVVEPCAWLEAHGVSITRVSVDADGLVDPGAVETALSDDTALVSIILGNNETGVVQPIEEIAERVKRHGVALHVDATQAVGKWPVDLRRLQADYLSCSAHKLNGPKGVGCLVVASDAPLESLLLGGGQERRQRGGTENVASIVGFGVACELATNELDERMARYAELRDRLWQGLRDAIPGVRRNGHAQRVLPNTLNVEFEGAAGEVVLQALDLEGIAVSAGAACHSGSITPSHVLTAMGRTPEQARGSLRLSVGHGSDEAQVDHVVKLLPELVERARQADSA
jgi:cysteine desulfurase